MSTCCKCSESNKKLKVGIIGWGIANGKHMPSLYKLDSVEMVAFAYCKGKG